MSTAEKRHVDLVRESEIVALMFASKAFVQLIANGFIGPLTHRYDFEFENKIPNPLTPGIDFILLQDRLQHPHVHRFRHHVLLNHK